MTRLAASLKKTLTHMARAVLVVGVLAAPVLAMPAAGVERVAVLEAPGLKKTGAGFVILMSLQRG